MSLVGQAENNVNTQKPSTPMDIPTPPHTLFKIRQHKMFQTKEITNKFPRKRLQHTPHMITFVCTPHNENIYVHSRMKIPLLR